MILVDVIVPGIERSYDFSLDENAEIAMVIEEIVGMICQKEHCMIQGEQDELLLCGYTDQTVLKKKKTLRDYGVENGTKLLLV